MQSEWTDVEKVNSCFDALSRQWVCLVFLNSNYTYKTANKAPLFYKKKKGALHMEPKAYRKQKKRAAYMKTKTYKNGLCTFGIFAFHQPRICIFKQTAGLLQPPNPHGLLLLKRMTRSSPVEALSRVTQCCYPPHSLLIFPVASYSYSGAGRHLWWRCQ